jgi:3',5'-cyclic-AMP phosphodiesterase
MIRPIAITSFIFNIFLISACSEMIEYSPYDTDIHSSYLNITESAEITREVQLSSDTLKFVLISDIHEDYDDLADAIKSINSKAGIRFVACCGDITNAGLAQEFKWYISESKNLNYPLITVIGNHDYLSNGLSVYTRLFGPSNMSFIAGGYKFIIFDNIIWEKNNEIPDYEWLSNELADNTCNNVILSHIPPFSGEMTEAHALNYSQTVDSANAILCLHGHNHSFTENIFNGVHMVVSADIDDREYYIISLINNQSIIERVRF